MQCSGGKWAEVHPEVDLGCFVGLNIAGCRITKQEIPIKNSFPTEEITR